MNFEWHNSDKAVVQVLVHDFIGSIVLKGNRRHTNVTERNFVMRFSQLSEERSCPIYNIGDELRVEDLCAVVPDAKPVCMILVEKLIEITMKKESFQRLSQLGSQHLKFDCGGCKGRITFQLQKDKRASPQCR